MGKTLIPMPMSTHHEHHSHDDHDHGDEPGCEKPQAPVRPAASCETACCGHDVKAAPAALGKSVVMGASTQTPIRIMQMDCPTEEALLRKKLGGMVGVSGMEFNLMQRVLTVTHEPRALESVLAAVRSLGFTPEIATGTSSDAALTPEPVKPWWPLALAGVAAIASEAVHWFGLPTWLAALLAVTAVLACGITT